MQVKKNMHMLSVRELEILELIARGWSNYLVADKLKISVNTVKYHLKRIFAKLKVNNRIEALNKIHELEH